jgi:hypothetical protein
MLLMVSSSPEIHSFTQSRSSRNQFVGREVLSQWPRCHRIYYAI